MSGSSFVFYYPLERGRKLIVAQVVGIVVLNNHTSLLYVNYHCLPPDCSKTLCPSIRSVTTPIPLRRCCVLSLEDHWGFYWFLPLVVLSSKLKWTSHRSPFLVAKLGFEPRQTEPESVVLPLHHLAVCSVFLRRLPFGNRVQNYCFFITYANNFYFFRQNICWFAKKAVILCPIFDYSLWRSA